MKKYKTRSEAMTALGKAVSESLDGPLVARLGRDLLDKQATGLGWRPSHMATMMLCLSGIVKIRCQGPRPYWLSDKIKTLDPTLETSYGFPSGHTTSGMCVFGIVAWHYNITWLWVAYVLFFSILAYSRVYTGAHFIHDVIGGAMVGGFILLFDIFSEVVLGHTTGTPGSLLEATCVLVVAMVTFYMVLGSAGPTGRIKLMMIYEGVSGAGFAFGIVLSHICERLFPLSCQEQIPLSPMTIVGGLAVLVVIDRLSKKLPDHPDGTRDHWSLILTTMSFMAIQFWALWLLPHLATTCAV